jgi:hypothetical protein
MKEKTLFDVLQCCVEKLSQRRFQFKRSIEILACNEFQQLVVVCVAGFICSPLRRTECKLDFIVTVVVVDFTVQLLN